MIELETQLVIQPPFQVETERLRQVGGTIFTGTHGPANGLHAVLDMQSRSEPHCVLRVYTDGEEAAAFERQALLPSRPYADPRASTK